MKIKSWLDQSFPFNPHEKYAEFQVLFFKSKINVCIIPTTACRCTGARLMHICVIYTQHTNTTHTFTFFGSIYLHAKLETWRNFSRLHFKETHRKAPHITFLLRRLVSALKHGFRILHVSTCILQYTIPNIMHVID